LRNPLQTINCSKIILLVTIMLGLRYNLCNPELDYGSGSSVGFPLDPCLIKMVKTNNTIEIFWKNHIKSEVD
jgi:hypothetical protein